MVFVELSNLKSAFGRIADIFQTEKSVVTSAPDAIAWDSAFRAETARNAVAKTRFERSQLDDLAQLRAALYVSAA